MAVRLGSNIAALGVQRFLNNASREVSFSSERLSSGMRINKSSDDAAGLAIATSLNASSRVYGQGIRNVNDAISLLNVAEGGVGELTNILVRLKELAQSSANGSLAIAQRRSLDDEADQLIEEYNRITQTTSFNGRQLLNGGVGRLVIQAGYGGNELFNFGLTEELRRKTGDGTYTAGAIQNGGTDIVAAGDFNRDGKIDVAGALSVLGSGAATLRIGNGDGTFGAQNIFTSLPAGVSSISDLKAVDFNSDGNLDVLTVGADGGRVFLGNGDGTFMAAKAVGAGLTLNSAVVRDFNGDGKLDVVFARTGGNYAYLGNGDGTFGAGIAVSGRRANINSADFNRDGKLDLISSTAAVTTVNLGVGDGTFGENIDILATSGGVTLNDFDDDGFVDVVSNDSLSGNLSISRGNGDGTFKASELLMALLGGAVPTSADINGDGKLDIISGSSDGLLNILLGNGDGTFGASSKYGTGATIASITSGDFNSDGVADFMSSGSTSIPILYTSNTQYLTSAATLNLNSQQGALDAMSVLDSALERVSKELGSIGSSQSRLLSGLSNLMSRRENLEAAAARIQDVDVASESARLTRNSILQQTAAALLGQVNQEPALVLKLLRP